MTQNNKPSSAKTNAPKCFGCLQDLLIGEKAELVMFKPIHQKCSQLLKQCPGCKNQTFFKDFCIHCEHKVPDSLICNDCHKKILGYGFIENGIMRCTSCDNKCDSLRPGQKRCGTCKQKFYTQDQFAYTCNLCQNSRSSVTSIFRNDEYESPIG